MTDPQHPTPAERDGLHDDAAARAAGGQPGWYGSSASASASSSAGWPDGAAPRADAGADGQGPYGQSPYGQGWQGQAQPGHAPSAGPYGQGPYVNPPYGGPAQGPMGMSITSLVIGIASLLGFALLVFPPIIGVVFGHLALLKEPRGRGMAIAGLVMNYLCVAGAVLLFSLIAFGMMSDGFSGV